MVSFLSGRYVSVETLGPVGNRVSLSERLPNCLAVAATLRRTSPQGVRVPLGLPTCSVTVVAVCFIFVSHAGVGGFTSHRGADLHVPGD